MTPGEHYQAAEELLARAATEHRGQDRRLVGGALRVGQRLICVVAKPTIPAYRKQATR